MATEEKNDNTGGGRPFQLRPSILSGSGFGSPFSAAAAVGDKPNKGFILRPSALTSAADKIESQSKTEQPRKRQYSSGEENKSETENNEILKKPKITEDADAPTKSESTIKLTDDIEKPTGIGSFGFAKETPKDESTSENNNKDFPIKNYFAQTVNQSDKIGFVFGNSSASTVGFGALKSDNGTETEASVDSATTTPEEVPFSEDTSHKKLLENATEYEKIHNNRQHYEEVEQFTGEEGEQHVLQIVCKLHVFDKEQKNWLERGRGNLRLNDKCQTEGCFQSRLVFRTQGTNLVQLNTKLWPDMCCEKVKEKGVRISAVDAETNEVKVYLITASIKDALQAYTAIDRRVGALKRSCDSDGLEKDVDERNESSNESTKDVNSEDEDEDSNSENEEATKRHSTPGNTECPKTTKDSDPVEKES